MEEGDLPDFLKWFRGEIGIEFPLEIPPDVHNLAPFLFASAFIDSIDADVLTGSGTNEFLRNEVQPGFFIFGHWGYGINAYNIYCFDVGEKTKVICRLPFGGAYTNNEMWAPHIRDTLQGLAVILRHGGGYFETFEFEDWSGLGFIKVNGDLVGEREMSTSPILKRDLYQLIDGWELEKYFD